MVSPSQLLDDFEIRTLVTRERYYKDTFQWDRWRSTYHPDDDKTWIDIAWIAGTIDHFVTESKKMVSRVASTHSIQPVDVEINGDKALATSYGHITLRFTEEKVEYDMINWGWWIHRAQRTTGSEGTCWRLTGMRFIYNRDSITPTRPMTKTNIDIQLDPGARESYKYMYWVLTRRAYNISSDMPGTDRPETIEALKAQEEKWLIEEDS